MKFYSEKFFKSSRSLLITTLIAFQLVCAVPAFILFISGFRKNELTIGTTLYIALLCMLAGGLAGFMVWLTIAEPLRKQRDARMASKHDVSAPPDGKTR